MNNDKTSKACCDECGKDYGDFQMDVVLTNEQWKLVSPGTGEGGLLCTTCIVRRGAALKMFTVAKLVFE